MTESTVNMPTSGTFRPISSTFSHRLLPPVEFAQNFICVVIRDFSLAECGVIIIMSVLYDVEVDYLYLIYYCVRETFPDDFRSDKDRIRHQHTYIYGGPSVCRHVNIISRNLTLENFNSGKRRR